MNAPLYQNARSPAANSNAGLVFDKYFAGWDGAFLDASVEDCKNGRVEKFGSNTKAEWVRSISERAAKASPGDAASRLAELCRKQGGDVWYATATSRFVTGTGIANPLENGFAFHHTLGVPYLAASSLKGAIRNYWTQWHDAEREEAELARILGSAKTGAASVVFFDMLPVAAVAFAPEVMTPHYGEWYQDGEAPGDWISPTPIPFIAVEAGAVFQIALAPRNPGNPEWKSKYSGELRDIIANALDYTGLGAKTAVGYGRFILSNTEAQAKRDGRALASAITQWTTGRAGQGTTRHQDATPKYKAGDVLPANTKLSWIEADCEVKTVEPVTLKPGIEIKVVLDDGDDDFAPISQIRQLRHIK